MAKAFSSALFLWLAITATIQPIPSSAQDRATPPSSVPVTEWLNGPDRQDIAWKVEVFQNLTLQQRHLVQVLATISGRDYLHDASPRDLHFVTKVADESGNWLDGESYSHFVQPARFTQKDTVHAFANLYLRPGSYTVAMIAYDSSHAAGNVWRTKLTVSPVSAPLADLGRDFPVIEFLPPATAALSLKTADWQAMSPERIQNLMLDPLTLGQGAARLPLTNKKPVRIDVVVDLSDNITAWQNQIRQGCGGYALGGETHIVWNLCGHLKFSPQDSTAYKFDEGLALQVGNLVSQLAPQSGCVRFSAIDALRQDLVADRIDTSKVDWESLSKAIASRNLSDFDVSVEHVHNHVMWFKQFIENVNRDNYECGLPNGSTDHVLVVVSLPMSFPLYAAVNSDTVITPVKSYVPRPASYHLRLGVSINKGPSLPPDPMEEMLSPLKPKFLPFFGADQLRQKLDFIMNDLEAPVPQPSAAVLQ